MDNLRTSSYDTDMSVMKSVVRKQSRAALAAMVERGLPFSTLVRLQKKSDLPLSDLAELLRIPRRTLMRRKAAGRLSPEESERLIRIERIFEQAVRLFEGDSARAKQWLTSPRWILNDQTPLHFGRTEIGAREVEDLIGRLEYGVFT